MRDRNAGEANSFSLQVNIFIATAAPAPVIQVASSRTVASEIVPLYLKMRPVSSLTNL
jgi:hypothetical protein